MYDHFRYILYFGVSFSVLFLRLSCVRKDECLVFHRQLLLCKQLKHGLSLHSSVYIDKFNPQSSFFTLDIISSTKTISFCSALPLSLSLGSAKKRRNENGHDLAASQYLDWSKSRFTDWTLFYGSVLHRICVKKKWPKKSCFGKN